MRKIVLLAIVCASMMGMLGFVRAEEFSSFDVYMNDASGIGQQLNAGNENVKNVKDIIQKYCAVIYSNSGFAYDGFFYSAKQSVFVYLLCQNIGFVLPEDLPKGFDDKNDSYFKLSSFLQLGIQDMRPIDANSTSLTNFCSPALNMNECNLELNIPKLFNMIINDYVNLKQPNMYGFDPTKEDEEKNANIFSQKYFNLEICNKSAERQYPQTCKTLKQYMRDAAKTMADVQIFRTDAFAEKGNADACSGDSENFSILLCGLYVDTGSSLQRFLNLVYNELFYYRLFKTYYTTTLQALQVGEKNILQLQRSLWETEVQMRVTNFANEFTRSQQAVSMTMRMLRDQYSAFPLHIGFLMYQEDLQKLEQPLSQLYTPLSQLSYYTLRNVQKKE